ncbi:MAG: 5'-nucleotidase C-terminal domain-containing protein [Chloroflexales bacterium]|nr:5'-nucleotidase C-terminal domain-containing protein [Chloroflexales bacterium]
MEKISRRTFFKRTAAVGAGALLTVYADGSYRITLAQEQVAYRLRILHTNDHHARIEPVSGREGPIHGGVSRRKTMIDRIRAETTLPLLLLDAGDIFQGTLYFNQYNGMADLEFYNAMSYDVAAIGNHEYDSGQSALASFIQAASFPVLSANTVVDASSPLAGLIKSNVIIERDGEKIGIFGLTTETTAVLSNPGPGVTFTPALEAAREQVAALQAAGASKIIALTHVGVNIDRRLAQEVAGISLIVGGHSHTPMGPMLSEPSASSPYPEVITAPDGKPVIVIQAWEWGRWLGDVTLAFNAEGRVIDVQGPPLEVLPNIEPDQGFENRIAVLREPLDQLRSTPVGEAAVALDGERANVRTQETNLGSLIADAMLDKATPDGAQLAIMNGGGIRTSIPVGPITVGQVLEVLPFGNTLARVDLTGAQVKAALENGVSQVETRAGRFPQVAGMRFSFDPTAAADNRVASITVASEDDLTPIDPNATYRVVTNSFLLSGGDGYSVFQQGANQLDLGFILADVVQEYIAAQSPVSATTDGRISQGAAAAAPAPVTAPAPTPVSLPATGSSFHPLWLLAALGAGAISSGAALRRRVRERFAEPVPAPAGEREDRELVGIGEERR